MKWHICSTGKEQFSSLAEEAGIRPILARILLARGVSTAEECSKFLRPDLDDLHTPALLPDIGPAAAAVASAVREKKKVLVCGDYDADGISGTALLVNLLRLLGLEPEVYLPDRVKEGYGVSEQAAETIAVSSPDLVITVDCGTSDAAAIKILRDGGAEVVVIDHHELGAERPDALVVNPKMPDSEYPFRDLAGVGVAFKVAWAVGEELSPSRKMSQEMRDFLMDSLALVALGTVADVAPLVGENRVLVAFGLRALEATKGIGLRTLLQISGLKDKSIKAHDISFRAAPRLNAAGRLQSARLSFDLLTAPSHEVAQQLAKQIDKLNSERKKVQKRVVREALEQASAGEGAGVVVLASPDWHVGIVGVAASRVVEQMYLPAVLLAVEGDTARGSARSIPGFNIFSALERSSDLLLKWGGHSMAAGLTLEADKIELLAERLSSIMAETLEGARPERSLDVDTEVSLSELSIAVMKDIERMAPFGAGNPRPVLAVRRSKVAGSPQRIGSARKHLSFYLAQEGTSLRTLWWSAADRMDELMSAGECSVAFTPRLNTWRGKTTVELEVKDLIPE